jgi:hypothetical protein
VPIPVTPEISLAIFPIYLAPYSTSLITFSASFTSSAIYFALSKAEPKKFILSSYYVIIKNNKIKRASFKKQININTIEIGIGNI